MDQPVIDVPRHKPWTILFYLCGDNPTAGLDRDIEDDLKEILAAGASASVHVAVQHDGPDGCARWALDERRPAQRPAPDTILGSRVDSGSPATLRDFLLWALERCPSDCLGLVMSGAGILDEKAVIGIPLNEPDKVFTICDDSQERSALEIRELAQVLTEVGTVRQRAGRSPRLELLAFDMCRMQFLEVACEMQDCVDVLIGPQTGVPSAGWDYGNVLAMWHRELPALRLCGDVSPDVHRYRLALARQTVDVIGRAYHARSKSETVVSALDLSQLDRTLGALDTMSLAYLQCLSDRVAWRARVAATHRLGELQEEDSYDAVAIFAEVARALGEDEIRSTIAASSMMWLSRLSPREVLAVLLAMEAELTDWLVAPNDQITAAADPSARAARQSLLHQWVRPVLAALRLVMQETAGEPWQTLERKWTGYRDAWLDKLAMLFGFPHQRGCQSVLQGVEDGDSWPTAQELAGNALSKPMLAAWVDLLSRCAASSSCPSYARARFDALTRELENARRLRKLVSRVRMLLQPPSANSPPRERLILAVFPEIPPSSASSGELDDDESRSLGRRAGISLFRPKDLAQLTRASYLALRFNQQLHWTALLTAVHLITSRPHQLWRVLSSFLTTARDRGRQELLALMAGPGAVLNVGGQFKALAPVPTITLSVEPDWGDRDPGAGPRERVEADDERRVYLTRLTSNRREAIIQEQRCRVNQGWLERLLADVDRAVAERGEAQQELDALGYMLGEDVARGLTAELEREQDGEDTIHLQLQLPRELLRFPWEIVRDARGPLGARYAIGRQVFLEIGLLASQRSRPTSGRGTNLRVLVIGNPAGAGHLPEAEAEARAVLATFEELKAETGFIQVDEAHVSQDVRVSQVRQWLRTGCFDIVHFCGHAFLDPDHYERSGWVLSDGVLEAEQISNTLREADSPPWLVYANACEAGMERVDGRFLQDVTGLASAFINHGVAAYIAPLWRVGDQPASLLAQRFYAELAKRRATVGESLRRSRAALRDRAGADGEQSYEWASMVLYGDSTTTLMQRYGAMLGAADEPALSAQRRSSDHASSNGAQATVSWSAEGRVMETVRTDTCGAALDGARAPTLTPEILQALRPHVVNLQEGRFSSSGRMTTTARDIDAIFEGDLEREWKRAVDAKEPLHIVLWAHGGLTDETKGLWLAHQQTRWWRENRVYPLFFVWETGIQDTLLQLLSGARGLPPPGARDIWDYTTDPAVEAAARGASVGRVWSAMKRSAELASGDPGGARYVAGKLAAFCAARRPRGQARVALHAVGHSAGAIFQNHFLPRAFELGVPHVDSVHLLAPALRVDAFKSGLAPEVGKRIGHLSMFTMSREWEEDDRIGPIYRKSLLYLVSRALEAEPVSPILGLEVSVREDPDVVRLFGLGARAARHAEVIWSVTSETSGRSASLCRGHGKFDEDRATMNSVLRRIVDRDAIIDFPEEVVQRGVQALDGRSAQEDSNMAKMKKRPAAAAAKSSNEGGGGSQRALCVGIDEYESAPLAGCVADAKNWRALFDGLGFETSMLTNKKATRQAILDGLGDLIRSSSAGDVIVFQYAGHGTWFEDQGSDEDDSRDEAFCPVDMDSGAYLLDDDVRELFATLPDGVNLTCFIDCCHSGSITRALSGGPGKVVRTASVRPRFIKATPEMTRAHRAFRKKMGGTRAKAAKPSGTMRQIVFAACQDREVAYESNGHGDFTTRALEVLSAGFDGMTHATFQDRVITAFGANARQKPNLDCDQARREDALLAALGGRSTVPIAAVGPAAGRSDDGRSAAVAGLPLGQPASSTEVAELLRAVANLLT